MDIYEIPFSHSFPIHHKFDIKDLEITLDYKLDRSARYHPPIVHTDIIKVRVSTTNSSSAIFCYTENGPFLIRNSKADVEKIKAISTRRYCKCSSGAVVS